MLSKNRLCTFLALCTVVLLVAACATQTQTASEVAAPQTVVAADTRSEREGSNEDAHAEAEEHADEAPSDDAHPEGDGHVADEHAADAAHTDGDGHAPAEHMAGMDMHSEGEEQSEGEGHAEGDEHGVPADAMTVENPVATTEESIAAGATVYTQYCAVCHGNEGKGDGPGAAGLNPKPADFSAEHVQVLSDGGLFWFITNGVPNSAMPPWGSALSEQQRWEVVNFLRTFKQE